jgi:predicted transcriptional regulator of viral defense system
VGAKGNSNLLREIDHFPALGLPQINAAVRDSCFSSFFHVVAQETLMLTIQDCIELSELTEDEILAIAEHEHIPEMAAIEMGNYLVHTPEGEKRIKRMILEDIEHARSHGNLRHAAALKLALRHFVQEHEGAK